MIIINERKIIKDSKQKECLAYLKDRSNNEYYARSVRGYNDGLEIRYAIKIDNFTSLFYINTNTGYVDWYNIDRIEKDIEFKKKYAEYYQINYMKKCYDNNKRKEINQR